MDQRQAFFALGLSGMVTKEQVKKRYRDLCKKLHPDDNSSKEAYEQYLLVQEAYQWMEQYYRYVVPQPRVFGQEQCAKTKSGRWMACFTTTI